MFCIYCGTRLPLVARFCRGCGRAVEDAPYEELSLTAGLPDPAPRAGIAASGPRTQSLTSLPAQLGRLPEWPEHFVAEILALAPDLGEQDRLALERACRAHVDAVVGGNPDVDLEALAEKLATTSTRPGTSGRSGPGPSYDPD
jgi:hypothetical protein